jgi:hypothetical protein
LSKGHLEVITRNDDLLQRQILELGIRVRTSLE